MKNEEKVRIPPREKKGGHTTPPIDDLGKLPTDKGVRGERLKKRRR